VLGLIGCLSCAMLSSSACLRSAYVHQGIKVGCCLGVRLLAAVCDTLRVPDTGSSPIGELVMCVLGLLPCSGSMDGVLVLAHVWGPAL